MRCLLAMAAIIVCALPAAAQEIQLPAEVKGNVGEFLKVPATTQGAVVRWRAVDAGLNLFPVELLKDTRTAVVVAIVPGRYRLLAWSALNGVPTEAAECVVVVAGPAPPPPNPPGPADPLEADLRAALAKEADGHEKVSELAKVCQSAATAARDPANSDVKAVRDLFAGQMRDRVAPKLPYVRGVVVRFLDSKLPLTAAPLTDELRGTIAHTFETIAASLERIVYHRGTESREKSN